MIFIFVKAVGLAPVLLAISSFIFLVFLLSYHTVRKSFEQLEVDRANFIEAGKKLYEIVSKLIAHLQSKDDVLNNYDKILSLAGTLHSQQVGVQEAVRANILLQEELEVVPALVKNISDLAQDTHIQDLLEQIQASEKEYQAAYRKYAYNLKYYNNFIEKLPSKWAAQLAGYKKQ
jgi:LemA protein